MTLHEDIQRIKQVMGLNESASTNFKRRLDELPKYIKSTYTWLNPKAFNSLEEFIDRVVFSSVRDFVVYEYDEYQKPEDLDRLTEGLTPYVFSYIKEFFLEEIKDYYYNHS